MGWCDTKPGKTKAKFVTNIMNIYNDRSQTKNKFIYS